MSWEIVEKMFEQKGFNILGEECGAAINQCIELTDKTREHLTTLNSHVVDKEMNLKEVQDEFAELMSEFKFNSREISDRLWKFVQYGTEDLIPISFKVGGSEKTTFKIMVPLNEKILEELVDVHEKVSKLRSVMFVISAATYETSHRHHKKMKGDDSDEPGSEVPEVKEPEESEEGVETEDVSESPKTKGKRKREPKTLSLCGILEEQRELVSEFHETIQDWVAANCGSELQGELRKEIVDVWKERLKIQQCAGCFTNLIPPGPGVKAKTKDRFEKLKEREVEKFTYWLCKNPSSAKMIKIFAESVNLRRRMMLEDDQTQELIKTGDHIIEESSTVEETFKQAAISSSVRFGEETVKKIQQIKEHVQKQHENQQAIKV